MASKPKILCVGDSSKHATLLDTNNEHFEVVHASTTLDILASLADQQFHCIYFFPTEGDSIQLAKLIQSEQILEGMPDGAALIDEGNSILWANDRMEHWCGDRCVDGQNFYAAFDQPDILGPDFCPFHTAITTGEESVSTLRSKDDQYFHVHAAPVIVEGGERARHLIVTVRDVTTEMLQQQKMAAIHKAGIELTNLSAEEIFEMAIEDRIELLKSNILHFTQNLLKFDVVEIRLLDQRTGELIPLLSEGINSENAKRDLYARPMDNGVTGFVAATGNSYLCEDTIEDPLYLEGHIGAKSSLTVPLIQHDQVIGTFNVESPQPHAFSENDLQFLEIFSRDVAVALNTLELLVAQQANTAQASVEAIHGKVALPVDEILNDAVNVMERYIGHESTVVKRLQRILRNARDIKQVIQRVGEEMTPAEAVAKQPQEPVAWPRLRGRRILVADVDESVRVAAHSLLERYGCIVETAHEGEETVLMVRNTDEGAAYDVIIADIRLPDMNGYELLLKLQQTLTFVPLVLMSGFGYDPGHSIVKARQAGLLPNAILYKPFRLDQLLATVDGIIENVDKVTQA